MCELQYLNYVTRTMSTVLLYEAQAGKFLQSGVKSDDERRRRVTSVTSVTIDWRCPRSAGGAPRRAQRVAVRSAAGNLQAARNTTCF